MEMTVIESGTEDIASNIAAGYTWAGQNMQTVRIRRAVTPEDLTGPPPDILVLSPDAVTSHIVSAPVECGILLLPGDADAEDFDAGCVVTYGMSPKNTITFSSIGEDTCVVALQRELLTVNGDMLERQEFKIKSGLRPDGLLAVAGALLILGRQLPEINP